MELADYLVRIFVLILFVSVECGRYEWMTYDHFDEMEEVYNSMDGDSCRGKSKQDMEMRGDLVTMIPRYNTLRSMTWYKNRTMMIHLHNMALNRAFFFSYIYQKLNETNIKVFQTQPNWMYMYFSVGADVNANPYGINASAIIFDFNCTYTNWFVSVPFNTTLQYFGPKAWRWEDYNDQDNFLREPTRKVAAIKDIGSGYNNNYTDPSYKMNNWYNKWMPDTVGDVDSLTKYTYNVGLRYSNTTGKFMTDDFQSFTFFGPPQPGQQEKDERMLPVTFTKPYFDCGVSDKWVVSATSPVVEFMPRYSNWTHLRRPRTVAVVVMDIDWDMIDFNSCPVSIGNPGPSYLSGISRCKPTTGCKHKPGYGFMRGGYVCVCKPGKRYPIYIDPPYQGDNIEQATDEEYKNGFDCTNVEFRQVLPVVDTLEGTVIEGGGSGGLQTKRDTSHVRRTGFISRTLKSFNETGEELKFRPFGPENKQRPRQYPSRRVKYVSRQPKQKPPKTPAQKLKLLSRKKRAFTYDYVAFEKMMQVFRQKAAVTASNCRDMSDATKSMPGSVAYGVNSQMESEGRTALRLAHFLSNFLQNTSPDEDFGNMLGGGRLNMEHVFGEVIANVMGNYQIRSSGVFFDTNQFINPDDSVREYFGPLAYQKDGGYYAIDSAGLPEAYVHEDWYMTVKSRWQSNTVQLKTFKLRPMIRSDPKGTSSIRFEHFPLSYKAPEYSDGYWTNPRFKCDGRVDDWIITYVVPFFGLDGIRKRTKFMGVVTVDVPLGALEINQCPQPFHVANAFKNTARCDLESTKCRPQPGFKFMRGSYRCDCKEGYEYMHNDGKFWIEGSLVEIEYEKKMKGLFSRFDDLRCRISGGSTITYSLFLTLIVILVSLHHFIL
ncbi:uncharacterized protein LOC126816272 [Patella vulgata]|uniref:uncharacterized protein LOC126816272 n=1 Tax=Patella vulgata TaxID=6465 RepID=UPI00217F95A7|nr:uncharacterized protein LOC126816272 [Patella vulgata]XP_050398523.1 uncharacterized protein LOC126816272 [Patella vulgata]XP_050398524.1 uncharacterized protein LOC126816272 [Patella vulgata]XP_050398525.1 uncharacterized protein LOC126816272 [Patella vulgata]XP_050398526.1 uncharacterized protein LOC126816272 [Patella vulgata]